MRVVVDLPILLDDVQVVSETTLEAAGAETVLVVSTAVPTHGLIHRGVYVGDGGKDGGLVVDVVQSGEQRSMKSRRLPGVAVTHDRARCLADHASAVQDSLHRLTGLIARVVITDAAAGTAADAFPPET